MPFNEIKKRKIREKGKLAQVAVSTLNNNYNVKEDLFQYFHKTTEVNFT